MKPQARPFTVEVKSRRRINPGPDANWSAVIDEPSLDDLRSRDVREDATDTPLWAASRVFSAFTSNAISTASNLGDLATSVFAPKPQQAPADLRLKAEGRIGRIGRILPSLLPVSPLKTIPAQENGPLRKPAKTKRPRKRAVEAQGKQELPEPTETAASPAIHPTFALKPSVAAPAPLLRGRKANRRRADARVPAGERWKRRRLPKACW